MKNYNFSIFLREEYHNAYINMLFKIDYIHDFLDYRSQSNTFEKIITKDELLKLLMTLKTKRKMKKNI